MTLATLSPSDLDDIIGEPRVQETDVTPDGYIFDVQTGEILGRADEPERFTVNSEDAANWVLELRSGIEGGILGLKARKAAMVAKMDAMIAGETRKLSWWEYRFGGELTAFAKRMLAGGKSKTARFNWGSVAFRATKGTNIILDQPKAIEYVEAYAPELVKVAKSVTVESVMKAKGVAEHTLGEKQEGDLPFMASSGPGENVTISTGVELEGSKK